MMPKYTWVTSSATQTAGNCVEVMVTDDDVLVRDTKDFGVGPVLCFTHADWKAFWRGVKRGEFGTRTR